MKRSVTCFANFASSSRPLRSQSFLISRMPNLVVSRRQLPQPFTHRRQVILPTPFPPPRLKLRIPSLHFFFEIDPHARHHLQISHHGFCNPVRNRLALVT